MSYLRNHKLLLLIIGVLLVANIGLLWFYVWKKPASPARALREDMKTKLKREIGFDDKQSAVYDSLREQHYSTIKPMFEGLRASRDSLFKLMHQPTIADSMISLQSEVVYEKQTAIDLKMHRYFRSLRDLCTEEQKPKMDSFLANLGKKMANGRRWGSGERKEKK